MCVHTMHTHVHSRTHTTGFQTSSYGWCFKRWSALQIGGYQRSENICERPEEETRDTTFGLSPSFRLFYFLGVSLGKYFTHLIIVFWICLHCMSNVLWQYLYPFCDAEFNSDFCCATTRTNHAAKRYRIKNQSNTQPLAFKALLEPKPAPPWGMHVSTYPRDDEKAHQHSIYIRGPQTFSERIQTWRRIEADAIG